jgi:uncharacterized membrane protein YvbJ
MSIYCCKCGAPNLETEQFCENCGTRLHISSDVTVRQNGVNKDVPIFVYNMLSFVLPLVGLLLYFRWKDKMPSRAHSIISWTTFGFSIGLIYLFSN